jgi:hypothetical protein
LIVSVSRCSVFVIVLILLSGFTKDPEQR